MHVGHVGLMDLNNRIRALHLLVKDAFFESVELNFTRSNTQSLLLRCYNISVAYNISVHPLRYSLYQLISKPKRNDARL